MDSAEVYYTFGEPIEPFAFTTPEALATHTWNVLNTLRDTHPDRIALKDKYNPDEAIKVAQHGTHEFIDNVKPNGMSGTSPVYNNDHCNNNNATTTYKTKNVNGYTKKNGEAAHNDYSLHEKSC